MGREIGGDFYRPSWLPANEDWVNSGGLWALTGPEVGTFASGNSLGRFLYQPGDDIPTAFLQEEVEEDAAQEEGFRYPGITGAEKVVGNHHPVFITFPRGRETTQPSLRSTAVRSLEAEEWQAGDDGPTKYFDEVLGRTLGLASGNVTTPHGVLARAIGTVFRDLYNRKPKQVEREPEDPSALCCGQNRHRPRLTGLRIAHHAGRHEAEQRLLHRVRAEGWTRVQEKTKPAETTKIYKLIRKQVGRQPRAFTFPRAGPLRWEARV